MAHMVACATVRDAGAAEVASRALEEQGIPVEVKRIGMYPLFGTVTGVNIEVRVPADRLADAEAVLSRLHGEAAEALRGESFALSPEAQAAADAVREAEPPARPRSPALGLVYSISIPLLGPFYAGAPVAVLSSLFIHLPMLYWLFYARGAGGGGAELAWVCWALGRLHDVSVTLQRIHHHNALANVDAWADAGAPPVPPTLPPTLPEESRGPHA